MIQPPASRQTNPGHDARGRLAALIRDLAPEAAAPGGRAPSPAARSAAGRPPPHQTHPPEPPDPAPPPAPDSLAAPEPTGPTTTPAELIDVGRRRRPQPSWAKGSAGRLVERWVPGGAEGVDGVRAFAGRHRVGTAAVALVALAGIGIAVALGAGRPTAEPAPPLPAAVSSVLVTSAPSGAAPPSRLVISVVGRVAEPGLVTVPNGARVADALRAAGGMPPGTDFGALNLARRLADGEQIYVGVPVPPGAADAPPDPPTADTPAAPGPAEGPAKPGKGKKSKAAPGAKVNLNTATEGELETLPGVGPATAQRIVTWRTQHGRFAAIGQLRDVGGIGQAKFAKLQPLVTT